MNNSEIFDLILARLDSDKRNTEDSTKKLTAIAHLRMDASNDMVRFHENVRGMLDDLTKLAMYEDRIEMLEYFISIIKEAKVMGEKDAKIFH